MPAYRHVKRKSPRRSAKSTSMPKRRAHSTRVSTVALGGVSRRTGVDKIPFTDVRGFRVPGITMNICTNLNPPSGGAYYGLLDCSVTPTTTKNFSTLAFGQTNGTVLIPGPNVVGPYVAYPFGASWGMGERLDEMSNTPSAIINRWDQFRIDSTDYTITFDGGTVAALGEGLDMEKCTLYCIVDVDDLLAFTGAPDVLMERPGFRKYTFDKTHRQFKFSYKPEYQVTGNAPAAQQNVQGGWFDTFKCQSLVFGNVKFWVQYDQPTNLTTASAGLNLSQNMLFQIDRTHHISVRGYK